MPGSTASRILGPSYPLPDDLAEQLAAIFGAGLKLGDLNLDNIDTRYARLTFDNEFTANQLVKGGRIYQEGAEPTENAVKITHAGSGSGAGTVALNVTATAGAGGLRVSRNLSSGATDHLVVLSENVSGFSALSIGYGGTGDAVSIGHTGGSGYGLAITARGINVTGASQFGHNVTIVTGGLSVSAGGVVVSAGGLTVSGAAVLNTGLTITASGLSVTGATTLNNATTIGGGLTVSSGGLIISAGGANVSGNSTFNNNLTVSGSLTVGGNTLATESLTVVTSVDFVTPAYTTATRTFFKV